MTRVLQRTSVASDTKGITNEVYKVALGVVFAVGLVIGVMSFAALGVGIAKAVLMISAAIG